jgi:hypothetical protein
MQARDALGYDNLSFVAVLQGAQKIRMPIEIQTEKVSDGNSILLRIGLEAIHVTFYQRLYLHLSML